MTPEKECREAFEEDYKRQTGMSPFWNGEGYITAHADRNWKVWQSAWQASKSVKVTDAQRQAALDALSELCMGLTRAEAIIRLSKDKINPAFIDDWDRIWKKANTSCPVLEAALQSPAVPREVVEEFVSMYCNVKIRGYGTRAENMSRQEWKVQYEQFEKECLALLGGKEG